MRKVPVMKVLMVAAVAALAVGVAVPALAERGEKSAKTPDNFSYDIKNGQRVPKSKRVTNADGSWTEDVRQGNCTVTRTGREGEVRETRKCD